MTTVLAIIVALIAIRLLVRSVTASLPVLPVVGLIALAMFGNSAAVSALAGPVLLVLVVGAGFWMMLRGLLR